MPHDPADVAGGEHRLPRPEVEDVPERPGQRHGVPAVVAHDALGAPGRAGGVEDVQRVRRLHRDAPDTSGGRHQLVVVQVTTRDHLGLQLWPLAHDDVGGRVLGLGQRAVQHRLVPDHPARLDAAGGRDDDHRARVVDARGELGGGEAAEHHRVHRPQPGAGEHGDRGLRHHRQVDDHPVPAPDPEAAEHPGEAGHLVEQLRVGPDPSRPGHRGVVHQRGLLTAAVTDVPVEGVEAGVEDATGEPAVQRGRVVVQHPGWLRVPLHQGRGVPPEPVGVRQGPLVRLGPRTGAREVVRLVIEHGSSCARHRLGGNHRRRSDRCAVLLGRRTGVRAREQVGDCGRAGVSGPGGRRRVPTVAR